MKAQKTEYWEKDLPLVLNVAGAAKLLHLGIGKCYDLVRCGRLRSIKVGKKILIPQTAVFEFLGMRGEPALDLSDD